MHCGEGNTMSAVSGESTMSESKMSALSLAHALWDERQALAGKPLHFPPLPPSTDSAAGAGVRKEPAAARPRAEPLQDPEALPKDTLELYQKLNADDRWALCLSGGGIRSAAFALGILQRLAALTVKSKRQGEGDGPALQQFEYLSTVSGGGYIGSWLSAWLFQHRQTAASGSVPCSGHAREINGGVTAPSERLT